MRQAFEWDEDKARTNLRQHGVSFGEAVTVFHDPFIASMLIHKADGTTVVQQFVLQEGTVMLEPDVQTFFPDSESVNNALRTLMTLFPTSHKRVTRTARASGAMRKVAAKSRANTESRNT